jgi:Flp pilus assembly protein protease CpaA
VPEVGIIAAISILFAILITPVDASIIATISISAIAGLSVLASHVDWKTCKIPNELVALSGLFGIAGVAASYNGERLLILGLTVLFLLIATTLTNFLTKGQLGAGDIKLLIPLSLLTYWSSPMAIFYGIIISFFLQLVLRRIWNKGKENPKAKSAPYGYALTLGILSALAIF